MVAIHETAYPRFKYNSTKPEIRSLYSPNEAEQRWMRSRRLDHDLQQVHMVYLKCFQRLGYFPAYSDIPRSVREYIAEFIDRIPVSSSYVDAIPGRTLRRLKTVVRRRCHVKRFTLQSEGPWLREFATDIAQTKESVIDMVNAMIELGYFGYCTFSAVWAKIAFIGARSPMNAFCDRPIPVTKE